MEVGATIPRGLVVLILLTFQVSTCEHNVLSEACVSASGANGSRDMGRGIRGTVASRVKICICIYIHTYTYIYISFIPLSDVSCVVHVSGASGFVLSAVDGSRE
jgi:hypothetical protein